MTAVHQDVYLGTGSRRALGSLGVLVDKTRGDYPYQLKGSIYRGNFTVVDPLIHVLPIHYEDYSVLGDPRLNLIGLSGMETIGITLKIY